MQSEICKSKFRYEYLEYGISTSTALFQLADKSKLTQIFSPLLNIFHTSLLFYTKNTTEKNNRALMWPFYYILQR